MMKLQASALMPSVRQWVSEETQAGPFPDERLKARFQTLLAQMAEKIGQSIPLACQDWANTKAAYRFFSNSRVNEQAILGGHFQSTHERFAATEGPVMVLHDTTDFVYKREWLGMISQPKLGKVKKGSLRTHHTVRGILMHSSLAVTAEGLPLGMAAIKFWTRQAFKGTNALKKHINPTRVDIEKKESIRWIENLKQSTALLGAPDRCVHIGDRESDIFELFSAAAASGTHFLVRTCVDRLAGDGTSTVLEEMDAASMKAVHRLEVRDKKGQVREATLELKYRRIKVRPPRAKEKRYAPLTLTVIHAEERDAPKGCEAINWKLITDLPVRSREEAIEKLDWYALRWKIELFHKILKSGCKTEESKLRTAERLVNLIASCCIVAWRIFWMTMLNRTDADASPKLALTALEMKLLDRLVKDSDPKGSQKRTPQKKPRRKALGHYLIKMARLGGYLARAHDAPPGNIVMWRGLSRLIDIELGFMLGAKS
jgi:hypothetical protein